MERLLGEAFGTSVSVVASERLAELRGTVERLTLDQAIPGVGSTVIAKARALGEWSRVSLATERAALARLGATDGDVGPRLLAATADADVVVMSDVGERCVEDVLFESDWANAESALVEMATTAGTLNRVMSSEPLAGGDATWTIGTHAIDWPALVTIVDELGLPRAADAAGDASSVVAAFLRPGSFRAFVHGDLTPNNAVIGDDGRCRLVDFEGAAAQHVGVDACMFRFPFAWYGRWALVPASVQEAMERAYREALARGADEVDLAIAVGCAAMAVLRLQRLAVIADADQSPAQRLRRRVQIVSTTEVAAEAATHAGTLPKLTQWFVAMAAAMRDLWEEASLSPPLFPAFVADGGPLPR